MVYGPDGLSEIAVERGAGRPGQGDALDALHAAIREGKRDVHDARWGKASVEIVLAILESARRRHEILLEHQAPVGNNQELWGKQPAKQEVHRS